MKYKLFGHVVLKTVHDLRVNYADFTYMRAQ